MFEKAAVLVTVTLLATACGGGDSDGDATVGPSETPTFSEDDGGTTATTSPGGDGEAPSATSASEGQAGPGGPGDPTPGANPIESVSFDDPIGDATPSAGTEEPPPWTDLAGGSLQRQGNAYRLAIRLGGPAPQTAPGSETMNIATFFDIDGDGAVEYELWVNLGREGWGPVWYDDQGNAAPGEASNVTVVVEGDEVRLLFPDVMIDAPNRLRFSTASEYGELSTIGTDLARRDDAPDDDRAVSFP